MRLLMLGGTEFVGRAVAEAALARGWQVTVFHRGRHAPPPGVLAVRGDRTEPGGLAGLDRGEWDVVVDTWTGAPSAVRDAARSLADRAGRYVYVSSRSVYAFPAPAGLRCRPVQETVADTWAWLRGVGGRAPQRPDRPPVGLDPDVEAKVLAG